MKAVSNSYTITERKCEGKRFDHSLYTGHSIQMALDEQDAGM
jgi:hypothetical protein